LADGGYERLQMRPRNRAHVEPLEHGVRELDEPDAEPVLAVVRVELDQPALHERPELAGDRARLHVRAPCNRIRAERPVFGEDVEDCDSPARSGRALSRRLTWP